MPQARATIHTSPVRRVIKPMERDPFGAAHIDDTREHLATLVQAMHSNLRMSLDPGARRYRDRWVQEANEQLEQALRILRG